MRELIVSTNLNWGFNDDNGIVRGISELVYGAGRKGNYLYLKSNKYGRETEKQCLCCGAIERFPSFIKYRVIKDNVGSFTFDAFRLTPAESAKE